MDKEKRLLAKKGKKFYNIELETRRNSSYVWNSYSSYKLHTTLKLKKKIKKSKNTLKPVRGCLSLQGPHKDESSRATQHKDEL